MDQYHNDFTQPETRSYQTGNTCPPKRHSALIAVLFVAVILLGGISSALGLLNIRLFQQINSQNDPDSSPVHFSQNQEGGSSAVTPQASVPTASDSDLEVQINQTPESVENIPQEGGMSLQDIYAKAIDSVVSISCTTNAGISSGTGVVLSQNGYLITNCHVIETALSIQVQFSDQRTLSASVIGADAVSDLAVLYVNATDLTPAEFGDSGALRVGDAVVAIGDPLGAELRGTMTNGIVSAINRDIVTNGRTMTLIQTNAALNEGNSGGPLLNCYGQVVGINTMKIGDNMSTAGVEGLGFAIPSVTVKEVVDQLISQGYVSGRPSLGLSGKTLSSFEQRLYRLPQGIYITEVDPDGDAAAKGISPGDILTSFDSVRITDSDTLQSLLYTHQAGDTVRVVIYRSGKQYAMDLILDEAK